MLLEEAGILVELRYDWRGWWGCHYFGYWPTYAWWADQSWYSPLHVLRAKVRCVSDWKPVASVAGLRLSFN